MNLNEVREKLTIYLQSRYGDSNASEVAYELTGYIANMLELERDIIEYKIRKELDDENGWNCK
jgi:hypothetical protein